MGNRTGLSRDMRRLRRGAALYRGVVFPDDLRALLGGDFAWALEYAERRRLRLSVRKIDGKLSYLRPYKAGPDVIRIDMENGLVVSADGNKFNSRSPDFAGGGDA